MTLGQRVHAYLAKRGDVYDSSDFSQSTKSELSQSDLVDWVFEVYEYVHPQKQDALDWLDNDIGRVIGYLLKLQDTDTEGAALWQELGDACSQGDDGATKPRIRAVLMQLPRYYLFSLIGMQWPNLRWLMQTKKSAAAKRKTRRK